MANFSQKMLDYFSNQDAQAAEAGIRLIPELNPHWTMEEMGEALNQRQEQLDAPIRANRGRRPSDAMLARCKKEQVVVRTYMGHTEVLMRLNLHMAAKKGAEYLSQYVSDMTSMSPKAFMEKYPIGEKRESKPQGAPADIAAYYAKRTAQ